MINKKTTNLRIFNYCHIFLFLLLFLCHNDFFKQQKHTVFKCIFLEISKPKGKINKINLNHQFEGKKTKQYIFKNVPPYITYIHTNVCIL